MRTSGSPARTAWLSRTSTAATSPPTRGATEVLSALTKALSVDSLVRGASSQNSPAAAIASAISATTRGRRPMRAARRVTGAASSAAMSVDRVHGVITSSVDVADASSLPAASVIRASANATRRPNDRIVPSARTGPVSAVIAR